MFLPVVGSWEIREIFRRVENFIFRIREVLFCSYKNIYIYILFKFIIRDMI